MKLVKMTPLMYPAVARADEDFRAAGERVYFGFSGLLEYLAWLHMLIDHAKGIGLPPGWSPYEINALVDDKGALLCLGQLRFGDSESNCTWAGHIGYTVPPSLRNRGYATEYLRLVLARAWGLGFSRAMLTCDTDNAASKKVIERCGGVFLDEYHERSYHKLRYWFYPPDAAKKGRTDK